MLLSILQCWECLEPRTFTSNSLTQKSVVASDQSMHILVYLWMPPACSISNKIHASTIIWLKKCLTSPKTCSVYWAGTIQQQWLPSTLLQIPCLIPNIGTTHTQTGLILCKLGNMVNIFCKLARESTLRRITLNDWMNIEIGNCFFFFFYYLNFQQNINSAFHVTNIS